MRHHPAMCNGREMITGLARTGIARRQALGRPLRQTLKQNSSSIAALTRAGLSFREDRILTLPPGEVGVFLRTPNIRPRYIGISS
jgi:hypothetical protein